MARNVRWTGSYQWTRIPIRDCNSYDRVRKLSCMRMPICAGYILKLGTEFVPGTR